MPGLVAIEMRQLSSTDHDQGVRVLSSMSLMLQRVTELTQAWQQPTSRKRNQKLKSDPSWDFRLQRKHGTGNRYPA